MRRSAVGWLALAVTAGHLAVLHWAVMRLPARVGTAATAPSAHRWLLAHALASPASEREVTPAPTIQAPAIAAPSASNDPEPVSAPPSLPSPAAAVEPVAADAADSAATESPGAIATRFYAYDEVETAAEPQTDWTIDVQALDALALSRIVVTLWVDERGTVLRCTVDEPARLSPAERDALAERIARTPLRPALRGGVAVASKRRIELTTIGG